MFSAADDGYDPNGAMLSMPHLQNIAWDYKSQLQMSQQQAIDRTSQVIDVNDDGSGTEAGERTWYVYDAGGSRIRKVTEKGGQILHERIYIGAFEVYRKHGVNPLVRETIHVMDDNGRVALVETRTQGRARSPAQLTRYQLSDHLGSVSLELDERARVVSYEEYFRVMDARPTKRWRRRRRRSDTHSPEMNVTRRRACRTMGRGITRAWLCRWTVSDPAFLVDGPNSYTYVSGRPTRQVDPSGRGRQRWRRSADHARDDVGSHGVGDLRHHPGVLRWWAPFVKPHANVVEYSGPKNGVGGVVGGVVRAATLRLVPIEDNASPVSLMGMEAGAGLVPLLTQARVWYVGQR